MFSPMLSSCPSDRRRFLAGMLALSAQAGLLLGCEQPGPPLRVSTNPWPAYDVLHVAKALGLLDQRGLQVDLLANDSPGSSRRALERGLVDGFCSTLVEVLQVANTTGLCPRILAVLDHSSGADVLIGREGMISPYDLRHKRIAIEPGTVHLQLLTLALESVQLLVSDVVLVPTPQPAMPAAFADGLVDGAVCFPPESNRLVELGGRVLFTSARVPGQIVDVLTFSPLCVERRGAELQRLVQVYFLVQEMVQQGHPASLQTMAQREGVSLSELQQTMAGVAFVGREAQARLLHPQGSVAQAMDTLQSAMQALGLLQRRRPVADFFGPAGA